MIRIVGGDMRGRKLAVPCGAGTRPTSDRVREAVFNVLAHGFDDDPITGVRVLDLFAGTGALGIEALSRGAEWALFVEEDAAARGLIRENIDVLGLIGVARVFRRDATRMGPAGRMEPFALVFLDPPYGQGLGEAALASIAAGGWLADGALCVLEERANAEVNIPSGFTVEGKKSWGETAVWFLRSGAAET